MKTFPLTSLYEDEYVARHVPSEEPSLFPLLFFGDIGNNDGFGNRDLTWTV